MFIVTVSMDDPEIRTVLGPNDNFIFHESRLPPPPRSQSAR